MQRRLDKKDRATFKNYDVTTWLKTIAMHILLSISRSKNQTMKFGQLIEYNKSNIFIEQSYTKCGRETILRPFSKKNRN